MRDDGWYFLLVIALILLMLGIDNLIINSNLPDWWKFVLLK